MMTAKLGIDGSEERDDEQLVSDLLVELASAETDMTIFFRGLADVDVNALCKGEISDADVMKPLRPAYYVDDRLSAGCLPTTVAWLRRYARRVRSDGRPDRERQTRMKRVNPKYVLRNYLAQLAIDKAEEGDPSMVHELLDVLRHPYDEQPTMEDYASKRPDWARTRPGCSMLSCSS